MPSPMGAPKYIVSGQGWHPANPRSTATESPTWPCKIAHAGFEQPPQLLQGGPACVQVIPDVTKMKLVDKTDKVAVCCYGCMMKMVIG